MVQRMSLKISGNRKRDITSLWKKIEPIISHNWGVIQNLVLKARLLARYIFRVHGSTNNGENCCKMKKKTCTYKLLEQIFKIYLRWKNVVVILNWESRKLFWVLFKIFIYLREKWVTTLRCSSWCSSVNICNMLYIIGKRVKISTNSWYFR
jgi:hypothetical protein